MRQINNGSGDICRPVSVLLRAYEALPGPVRRALAACDVEYDPLEVAAAVERYGVLRVVAVIPRMAAVDIAAAALEAYGPDHPQARPP